MKVSQGIQDRRVYVAATGLALSQISTMAEPLVTV